MFVYKSLYYSTVPVYCIVYSISFISTYISKLIDIKSSWIKIKCEACKSKSNHEIRLNLSLKGSLHTESEFFIFVILSNQNACYGCENAENRSKQFFVLWCTNVSEAACKRDWHDVKSYLFFNVTRCAMAFNQNTDSQSESTSTSSI